MKTCVVVVHPVMGVYVGNSLGLGFWTLLDAVGQKACCTFENEDAARGNVKTWENHNDPDAYQYVTVRPSIAAPQGRCSYASIDDLKNAGLEDKLGDLLPGFKKEHEIVGVTKHEDPSGSKLN